MKALFLRHYEAIKARGFITNNTASIEFVNKIDEEFCEAKDEIWNEKECNILHNAKTIDAKTASELMDIICVCANWLIHAGYDINELLEKNVLLQEKRAKEGK